MEFIANLSGSESENEPNESTVKQKWLASSSGDDDTDSDKHDGRNVNELQTAAKCGVTEDTVAALLDSNTFIPKFLKRQSDVQLEATKYVPVFSKVSHVDPAPIVTVKKNDDHRSHITNINSNKNSDQIAEKTKALKISEKSKVAADSKVAERESAKVNM